MVGGVVASCDGEGEECVGEERAESALRGRPSSMEAGEAMGVGAEEAGGDIASCDDAESQDDERAISERGGVPSLVDAGGRVKAVGVMVAGASSWPSSAEEALGAVEAEATAPTTSNEECTPGEASAATGKARRATTGEAWTTSVSDEAWTTSVSWSSLEAVGASSLESGRGSSEVDEASASGALGECGTPAFHKRTGTEIGQHARNTKTSSIFLVRQRAGGSARAGVADSTGAMAGSAGTELCGTSAADIVERCRFVTRVTSVL